MRYLETAPWLVGAFITMLFVVLMAVIALFCIRRKILPTKLKGSHDVVGFTYGIIGVVYAVLLGFTVVNVQERYNEADRISELEANYVVDLYRDAGVFGSTHRDEIQRLIKLYIDNVIHDEWPLMQEGKTAESVVTTVRDLWYSYYKIEPKDDREKIWLTQSVDKLNEFTNIRLRRVYNSNDSLSTIMWVLLYLGAAITIGFLGFFWVDNFTIHLFLPVTCLMTA